MNPVEIRARLRAVPFVPFQLVLADGRTFDVRHPDSLLVTKQVINIAVDPLGQDRIPRHAESVAPSRVVSMLPLHSISDAG